MPKTPKPSPVPSEPRYLQRLVRRCLGVLAKALDRDPFYGFACEWQWFRRAKGGVWEKWILDYPVVGQMWFEKATYPDESRPNGGARGTPTVETWPQPNTEFGAGYDLAIVTLRAQASELEPELLELIAKRADPERQNRLAGEINICRTAAEWLEDKKPNNNLSDAPKNGGKPQ